MSVCLNCLPLQLDQFLHDNYNQVFIFIIALLIFVNRELLFCIVIVNTSSISVNLNNIPTYSLGYLGTKKSKFDHKGKGISHTGTSQTNVQQNQDTVIPCFFCKKAVGHVKKDCPKYHKWLTKKGNQFSFVCCEFNLAEVPPNTWWIDTGTTIHISVSMQGCLRSRIPSDAERFINMGDGNKVRVEAIGVFRLKLESGF